MQVSFRRPAALALGLALAAAPAARVAQAGPATGTDTYLDAAAAQWEAVSRKIWDYAETGLAEHKSSALLEETLEKEGFAVTRGVAGMPTAFVATAGSGAPVVAILAEYDALPGLSQ
jgi:aminobenzoyl-glutamate utilization protein B